MIYQEQTQWQRRKPNLRDKTKILDFFNTEIEIIKENLQSTLNSDTVICFQHTWACAVQALAFCRIVLEYGLEEQLKLSQICWYEGARQPL